MKDRTDTLLRIRASLVKVHYRLLILAVFAAFLAPVSAELLPDRYTGSPEVGYFGRMSKVLFDANVTDTTIATDMIIREVFGKMDMKSEIVVYDSKNELIDDLSRNLIDGVFINTIDFLDMQHLLDMERLYTLIYGNSAEQRIYLLVRESDNLATVSDLKGKSLSIPKGHFLGRKYLDVILMENSQPLTHDFFTKINETVDTNTAIVDLYFNKTDAALVSDIAFDLAAELNPHIRANLKPIAISDYMVPQIIAMNKNISATIRNTVDRFLIKSHNNKRIKHLLSLFRARKFVKLNHSHILTTRKLIDRHKELSQTR